MESNEPFRAELLVLEILERNDRKRAFGRRAKSMDDGSPGGTDAKIQEITAFLGVPSYNFASVKANPALPSHRLVGVKDWREAEWDAYRTWCEPGMRKWYLKRTTPSTSLHASGIANCKIGRSLRSFFHLPRFQFKIQIDPNLPWSRRNIPLSDEELRSDRSRHQRIAR